MSRLGFRLVTSVADNVLLAIVRTLVFFIRAVPESLGLRISRIIMSILWFARPRWRNVGLRNLELTFPELTDQERRNILAQSFEVLAKNLYTFAMLPRLTDEFLAATVDYTDFMPILENVEHPTTVGKIMTTFHFGPFELFPPATAYYYHPVAILSRGFGLPKLDKWWTAQRQEQGNQMFERKGGMREMLARLNQGQDVAILIDQNVKKNHAVFVDFFGIKASFTRAVGLAALKTGAPVVFGYMLEEEPRKNGTYGTYKVRAKQLPHPSTEPGDTEEKIQRFSQHLSNAIEDAIRQQPHHWFWIHRRFKTRPPGDNKPIYN